MDIRGASAIVTGGASGPRGLGVKELGPLRVAVAMSLTEPPADGERAAPAASPSRRSGASTSPSGTGDAAPADGPTSAGDTT